MQINYVFQILYSYYGGGSSVFKYSVSCVVHRVAGTRGKTVVARSFFAPIVSSFFNRKCLVWIPEIAEAELSIMTVSSLFNTEILCHIGGASHYYKKTLFSLY